MVDRALEQPTPQAFARMCRAVANLFDRWQLSTDEQLAILGYAPDSPEALHWLVRGDQALTNDTVMLDRIERLLRIHASLRLLFPDDPALRYSWVRRRNDDLDGRTPLDALSENPRVGLALVERLLDSQRQQ
jgi:hypothetical protein